MEILYRPHRGSLSDSMSCIKTFLSVDDLIFYLVSQYENAFSFHDVVIKYYCYDERIDWETFSVSVKRFYNQIYDTPQIIGLFTTK